MGRAKLEQRRSASGHAGGAGGGAAPARWRSGRARWLWLVSSWIPVWALFAALIVTAHRPIGWVPSLIAGLRMSLAAALLGFPVQRLLARRPWPEVFRWRFFAFHLVAAPLYAAAWILLNSAIESAAIGRLVVLVGPGLGPFLVVGVWIYLVIAGVVYAIAGTERAAHAEAAAVASRLDALRSQLNPHFLFNALHTVIHLIPQEPRRAAWAAEQLAALLRVTIEEDRDEVSLAEEWAFVERYLDIERIRFGERLRLRVELSDAARAAWLPSFAVQTLVENALRHGVAPAVEPTDVSVEARIVSVESETGSESGSLVVEVRDNGAGATAGKVTAAGQGTALARLRDRLQALYGEAARLDVETAPGQGFRARLTVPQEAP